MANYKLVFRKSVSKDFRPIPNKDVTRILKRIEELQEEPRPIGSEKLSGQERYRIRQGVYRIIYEVADELLVVTVVKVGHRKHVYKRS
ncbi:type II toxin-antitoxin system RelE family toxin [Vreelandella arcis]|uniref:mRNA interferase RelE/StbE n=1 Tax=Vreelandella arcis TaxID=416873 RepID=A0A1H0CPD2_9GAMM|nr:type II toxin-antitoxin system RelE/ParE family toxin [Halomonas arcis]SDN59724.1 mRNA interferase RelE/StbE [Halomonas arcis]